MNDTPINRNGHTTAEAMPQQDLLATEAARSLVSNSQLSRVIAVSLLAPAQRELDEAIAYYEMQVYSASRE